MATYSSKKYPAGQITTTQLEDGTIVAVDLASDSVTTAKIADSAVTVAKTSFGSSTASLNLPSGTTAQRPGSPTAGTTRYNSSTGSVEFYNGTTWVSTNLTPVVNSVTGNIYAGVTSTLTLSLSNATETVTVRFSEGGTTVKDVTLVTVTAGSASVSVPSEVYGQTAGDTIVVSVLNSDNTPSSNSVSKTVLALPTGGTITTSSSYRIHSFTSSGDFVVPSGVSLSNVEYLVIAGGGGNQAGQGGNREAGSGAGGYRCSVVGESSGRNTSAEARMTLTAGTYSVVVGAGGTGRANGNNSSFNSIVSTGGGYGGNSDSVPAANGGNGGSGGGSWYTGGTPGTGTAGQGYDGSAASGGNSWTGGSGGGAGGAPSSSGDTPIAGVGLASSITGTSVTRAAGGRGNRYSGTAYNTSGASNTGNGAEGIGNGGSGVVIVRYVLS